MKLQEYDKSLSFSFIVEFYNSPFLLFIQKLHSSQVRYKWKITSCNCILYQQKYESGHTATDLLKTWLAADTRIYLQSETSQDMEGSDKISQCLVLGVDLNSFRIQAAVATWCQRE